MFRACLMAAECAPRLQTSRWRVGAHLFRADDGREVVLAVESAGDQITPSIASSARPDEIDPITQRRPSRHGRYHNVRGGLESAQIDALRRDVEKRTPE